MSVNHCIDSISLFCDHEGISGVNTNAEHKRAILALSDRIQNRVWIEKNLISLYLGDLGGFQKLFDMVKSIVREDPDELERNIWRASCYDDLQHWKNSSFDNFDFLMTSEWPLWISMTFMTFGDFMTF